MIDFLIMLISFIAFAAMLYLLFLEEEGDYSVHRRLLDIKEGRAFGNKGDKETDKIYEALAKREKAKKSNIIEMLKDQSDYRIAFLGEFLNRFSFTDKIRILMKQADVKMPIDVFFMIINLLFLPFLVLAILKNNIFFMVGGIVLACIPFGVLVLKYKKRVGQFAQYFPDSLGVISNSLRAGHSLLASFQMVAGESPYPVNKLFKTVSDEISLGKEVREAMIDMSNYMPDNQDLKFFITAVLIQKEIGGNLAEILDTLNFTIREREKIQGLIKTQTAQAQLSGIVLGLAPVAIAGLVTIINPQYMEPLFNSTIGNLALFTSFFMSFVGFMIIRKITQIRV